MLWRLIGIVGACVLLVQLPAVAQPIPECSPGGLPIGLAGSLTAAEAKSYEVFPFFVVAGTTRIDVRYDWGNTSPLPPTPLTSTTVDLGLWDTHGYRDPDGFRGWSGSRSKEVYIQQDVAERGYRPGPIDRGTWWLELGYGAVSPDGGFWTVEITCSSPTVGAPFEPDVVDSAHIARSEPAWYHGDFHMHGYHSHPQALDYQGFVDFAVSQGLDFFPLTEYVTVQHWDELGAFQRANHSVLFVPSREIITYFGHAIGLGETRGFVEYRHGFEDVTMTQIQQHVKASGALFQVAHPTTFSGPLFQNFCRGCEWTLTPFIDWDLVDTMELQTGPGTVHPFGNEAIPGVENPFMAQAIDLWESLLQQGYKITAVGGSDDKVSGNAPTSPEGSTTYAPHGVPATAVFADELSQSAILDAVQAGRVYIRVRGVARSPELAIVATSDIGESGIFGDVFAADEVDVALTVVGGQGQVLTVVRNGSLAGVVPITSDPFTHSFIAARDLASEGPLGTWWRFETADTQSRTALSNPIFVGGPPGLAPPAGGASAPIGGEAGGVASPPLPTTGSTPIVWGLALVAIVVAARGRHRAY